MIMSQVSYVFILQKFFPVCVMGLEESLQATGQVYIHLDPKHRKQCELGEDVVRQRAEIQEGLNV